jgi:hypothetical protein
MGKKQLDIPGTERKTIKAIEEAAEEYQELKEKRAAILSKEIAAKGKLLELMKKHEQKNYKCGESDLLVSVVIVDETIKVKHVESDEEAAEALAG